MSQNATNAKCGTSVSKTRIQLQMLAAASATASAPREPVNAAVASAPAAHSSIPPAKSPPR